MPTTPHPVMTETPVREMTPVLRVPVRGEIRSAAMTAISVPMTGVTLLPDVFLPITPLPVMMTSSVMVMMLAVVVLVLSMMEIPVRQVRPAMKPQTAVNLPQPPQQQPSLGQGNVQKWLSMKVRIPEGGTCRFGVMRPLNCVPAAISPEFSPGGPYHQK